MPWETLIADRGRSQCRDCNTTIEVGSLFARDNLRPTNALHLHCIERLLSDPIEQGFAINGRRERGEVEALEAFVELDEMATTYKAFADSVQSKLGIIEVWTRAARDAAGVAARA